jgi:hypothetical protein
MLGNGLELLIDAAFVPFILCCFLPSIKSINMKLLAEEVSGF